MLLCAVSHVAAPSELPAPRDWEAVNTDFGSVGLIQDSVEEFRAAQWIQRRALESRSRVIVFPETVVSRWNEATEVFWEPTFSVLRTSGKTIIIGVGISLPDGNHYENAVLIRGLQNGPDFFQRIPVPLGMWRPLTSTGVPLHLRHRGTIRIGAESASILICYEQLLVWPVLAAEVDHPTVIVGLANSYWVERTHIPQLQLAALRAWARLFRPSLVAAVNG
jgi:apolipoprotein N-acyltransferase